MTEKIIDIETNGLVGTDQITVASYLDFDTNTFIINYLDPEAEVDTPQFQELADPLPDAIAENFHFHIESHETEQSLLTALYEELASAEDQVTLIGYNSNNYDLPTIRTRSVINNVEWGFNGCYSRDLYNTFQYKFNTTGLTVDGFKKKRKLAFGQQINAPVDDGMYSAELTDAIEEYGYSTEQIDQFVNDENLDRPTKESNSLDDVHELLGGEITDCDPFEDSSEAVEAFSNGDIIPLLVHNIVDLIATMELNSVAKEYVSPDEIRERQL